MSRIGPVRYGAAALLAVTLPASAPAMPSTRPPARSPLADYVRARAADALGADDQAAIGYAAAMAAAPDDAIIALRAFRQAITAGDRARAIAAARTLDAAHVLPPDGRLLLIGEAVGRRDWTGARAQIATLKDEQVFAFTAPVIEAWVTLGARGRDPLAPLAAAAGLPLASAYAAEHRALLLLATGRLDDGVVAIEALGRPGGARGVRLRIASAAVLARDHRADRALALLAGDDPVLGQARAALAAHRSLPGAVLTPADGIAELMVRVGADINRERATPIALTLARVATFLAPDNAEAWLSVGTMLVASADYPPALAALDHVSPRDPFVVAARDLRVQLLIHRGDREEALKEALAAAGPQATAADWSRVGDLYVQLARFPDAAAAYERAQALAGGDAAPDAWQYWLQRGSALEQGGDWAAARPALRKAVTLAPDEPSALNYLGYAELDRHEDVAAAMALIQRASALKPDDPAITDSLGWAYYLRGDLAHAIPTLERAAAAEPAESDINEHLGDAYWAAGRKWEARYAWRAALVAADASDMPRLKAKIDTGAIARP